MQYSQRWLDALKMKNKARGAPADSPGLLTKAHRMASRLREQHALGRAAILAQQDGKSIAELAAKHGYSEHTLRKIKAFAHHFSQPELDELCRGRRPNGLPLHWGYIPYLLAIESKHGVAARKKLQKLVINEGWSVSQLNREVRERFGVSGHGRPLNIPENLEDGLDSLTDGLELLLRRCEKLRKIAKAKRRKTAYATCRRLSRVLAVASRIVAGNKQPRRPLQDRL